MFELRDRGHGSPFAQLIGSLISARTRDETTVEICLRLFAVAHTPDQLAALDEATLADLLHGATFPQPPARALRRLALPLLAAYHRPDPGPMAEPPTFRGPGPKTAANR